jgi:hypothetical protein
MADPPPRSRLSLAGLLIGIGLCLYYVFKRYEKG